MKSLRLHAIGDVRVHEEAIPEPKPGEALLRVTAVGICGSDIHWYAEGSTGDSHLHNPFVLGHEFAAVVENGELAGTRVAVEPHVACGHCSYCEEGKPNLCPHHYFAGQSPQDGAMRQYMTWPEAFLFPIPDNISDEAGAMLEPLGVGIHTVDMGELRAGMRVGVYGCGPIGLIIIQLARLSGAVEIFATDKLPHRLETAQRMGATAVFLADDTENIPEVDVAFEAAGDQGAVDTAMVTCKPGGCVVLCGIPSDDNIQFRASTARRKEMTIKVVRRMKHTYPRAIDLVSSGLIDLDSLVSHCFSLEEGAEAFRLATAREGLKVVIQPS